MQLHECKEGDKTVYKLELVNEYINLDSLPKVELLDLFWKADNLSFEDKQKLVTYLNARGHNLNLFRGEMRGNQHFITEYWDGTSWKEFKRDYDRF